MKKYLLLLVTMLLLMASPCYADSPITSTSFSDAYLDVEIVKTAAYSRTVDQQIAAYLKDNTNPIDIRAAVINALGPDIDDEYNNPEMYSKLIYGKPIADLKLEELSGDELFCLGYLLAMDDYFDTQNAADILAQAESKLKDSYTVAMVAGIVYAQGLEVEQWEEIWGTTDAVIKDKSLKMDMYPEAAAIIVDYMSLYSNKPVLNPYWEQNTIILQIGNPNVYVNENEYELDFNRGTQPEIKAGRTFLPIAPLIEALGGTVNWNDQQKKVTIVLGSDTIELQIGNKQAMVNGVAKSLEVAPYISNGRTMLPLRFIIENLGLTVDWNQQEQAIIITV